MRILPFAAPVRGVLAVAAAATTLAVTAPQRLLAQTAPAPAAGAPAATPAPTGPTLTLEEALALARRNNPSYLQSANATRRESANLLGARGNQLPTLNSSFGSGYREGRPQFFAGQAFGNTSGTLSSDAGVNAFATISPANIQNARAQRATLEAAEADVTNAGARLRTQVTQQYLNVLEQQARIRLQDTLVSAAQLQLDLAKARQSVGSGTVLDVRRAEVQFGQARVQQLQARNQADLELVRLFQQLGVPQPAGVRLTTEFPFGDVPQDLEALIDQAHRQNPGLAALRQRERAATIGTRAARSQYLPALQFNAGVSGFTQQLTQVDRVVAQNQAQATQQLASCQTQAIIFQNNGLPVPDCSRIGFDAGAFRSANQTFPFQMTRAPYNLGVQLSLPIFNGFQREQQVQLAEVARRDADYALRAQDLQVRADVTSAVLSLRNDRATVDIQRQNVQAARDALQLAEERYRLGIAAFIDVAQARSDYERAQNDLINAVFQFHRDFAALEQAVGRPLR
ncbi:MAG TPA: TolC family protein [Gemmatirosa sp.]|nr:TolC family protein [Gemmatirosa sp.]